MSKKNNFRKTWRTLTELGQEFGVSAVKFGNLLKQHGLREQDGEPTQNAKDGGFFEKIVPNDGKPQKAQLEIHTGVMATAVMSDTIACQRLRVEGTDNSTKSPYAILSTPDVQELSHELVGLSN